MSAAYFYNFWVDLNETWIMIKGNNVQCKGSIFSGIKPVWSISLKLLQGNKCNLKWWQRAIRRFAFPYFIKSISLKLLDGTEWNLQNYDHAKWTWTITVPSVFAKLLPFLKAYMGHISKIAEGIKMKLEMIIQGMNRHEP